MKNQNPHNIPVENVAWLSTRSESRWEWENPLVVVLGPSDKLQSLDGRPFVCIAEMHAPTKCTFHCHPDNFKPMVNFAKRIALGMEPLTP